MSGRFTIAPVVIGAAVLAATAVADDWVSMSQPKSLSEEIAGGAVPGGSAQKGRLVRLANTTAGAKDGRLVVTYADANLSSTVWDPQTLTHPPRDVFARYSDDDGKTWSAPVNISNSAGSYSAVTDHDGDGADSPYYGDCDKATVAAAGDVIVVTWVGKYAPEPHWTWGQSGVSAMQGTVTYDDPGVPFPREVPFSAVYLALSTDGGSTWTRGDVLTSSPPLQLTYGRRDAINDVHRGSGKKWVVTWQEDPLGLQPGEAEGPGEGASGAKGSPGTDVWYTWVEDIVADPTALVAHRAPLSNHSYYDMTYPDPILVGKPGAHEAHAATRPNISLVKVGAAFTAILAYEESKGSEEGSASIGKKVQYHAFPYQAPIVNGACECMVHGDAGATLSPLDENSRRVRFVAQSPNGVDPAIFVFWRQGIENEGGPGDIVGRIALTLDPPAVAAATSRNFSSSTPTATDANLSDATSAVPQEDARAHRAILRGSFLALGFSYTRDLELAETTTTENYDFWLRRSHDGGVTWSAAANLSQLPKTENVLEPRLVAPAASIGPDPSLVVAFGTETNVNDALGELPVPGDVEILRSRDLGATWSDAMTMAGGADPERESQLVVGEDAARIWAVWMASGATEEMMYAELTNEWFTPGDVLRVRFAEVGAIVDTEFDAVHHQHLKLRFAAGSVTGRVRAEVFGPLGDAMPTLIPTPLASFELAAGKANVAKVCHLPASGRYLLRFTHLEKGLGPFVVETGRKLPPRGKDRKIVIAPDLLTLVGHWSVQLLAGGTFDVELRPFGSFAGTPAMGLTLPGGDSFDCSGYAEQEDGVVRYVGMPSIETGTHRIDLLGFGSKKDRCILEIRPTQPKPGDAVIDIP